MSVLTEIDGGAISQAALQANGNTAQIVTVPPEVVAAVKTVVNREFWKWYHAHENDHVATVHFWLFQKDVKVQDLHNVFVLLFGGEGEDQSVERPPATIPPATT